MVNLHSATARGRLRSAPLSDSVTHQHVHESRHETVWAAALVTVGVLGAAIPPLSVPGVVLTLILGLSFPTGARGKIHRFGQVTIALAAIGCVVGLGRFALSKAMLGIVEGDQSATAFSTLWRVREVVIAEDALRRNGAWDPDGDHVGSAALIGALAGKSELRPGVPLGAPLLNYAFGELTPTALGPAARIGGYLVIVCLPAQGGGFTARPGETVDDEAAERSYEIYAWPSEIAKGMTTAFFADEHERILVLDPPRGEPAPYLGAEHPPACSAATGADGRGWKAWKNKKPRERLPGG
jgi:hypothetical protein